MVGYYGSDSATQENYIKEFYTEMHTSEKKSKSTAYVYQTNKLFWKILDCQKTLLKLIYSDQSLKDASLKNFVLHSRSKLVKVMLIHQANPNSRKSKNENTPLHIAASLNAMETVALLIAHKASVNLRGDRNRTPLCYACSENKSKSSIVVKLLLQAKAKPNRVNSFSDSPLHYAASHNTYGNVKLLLDNAAQINGCNNDSVTPLYLACTSETPNVGMVKLLLKHQANPFIGESALQKIFAKRNVTVCATKTAVLKQLFLLLSTYYTKEQLVQELWNTEADPIFRTDPF
jgi:ankyrin repeat protein